MDIRSQFSVLTTKWTYILNSQRLLKEKAYLPPCTHLVHVSMFAVDIFFIVIGTQVVHHVFLYKL